MPQDGGFGYETDNDDRAVPQEGGFGHGSRMGVPLRAQRGLF